MKKNDPVAAALEEIAELRTAPDAAPRLAVLLNGKVNIVVAKAARLAGELRLVELVPQLSAAFHRLMKDPAKLDKGCAALTAIVHALYGMDCDDTEVYLRGLHHVQREASFGPPVDVAAPLRSACAAGMVHSRHPNALFEVEQLLVDPEATVRAGAARAIATLGSEAAELLLRLKLLTGDDDTEVLAECFAGILASHTDRALRFVAPYLDNADEAVAEAAALALGESRFDAALAVLEDKWKRTARGPMRRVLLLAFASARHDRGFDFLLGLLETESENTALEVLTVLRVCKNNERVMARVQQILSERGNADLSAAYRADF